MVLSPNRWKSFACSAPLSWSIVKFDKANINHIPKDEQGVYTFVVKPDIANHPHCSYLMYVGKTERQGFRERFKQYFSEAARPKGRPAIHFMVSQWIDYLWFCYAPVNDIKAISSIEDSLISAYLPPVNKEYPGKIGKAVQAWL